MKMILTAAIITTIMAYMTSCSSHRDKVVKNGEIQPTLTETFKEKITIESVNQHIADWPVASKKATEAMLKEHGIPHGVTNEMMVWNNVASFKTTVVHRDGILHNTRNPHVDVVENITADQTRVCEDAEGVVKL